MHTINLLIRVVEHHQILVYFVILLGLVFEGEVLAIATGVLVHLGAINIYATLLVMFCGVTIKIFAGYFLGKMLFHKYDNKFFQHLEKKASALLPHFNERPFWSIFISKFMYGTNNPAIIFAGYKKINFRKYLEAEFIATVIWIPLMLAIGYFFSYTALHMSREIGRFVLTIVGLVVLFVIFDKVLSWVYGLFEEGNKQ